MTNYKRISIYSYTALTLLVIGIVTKYFLVDSDLGARFKNFNHRLLSSDLIFILTLIIFLLGQLFRTIKQNKKSKITDTTIFINLILLMPLLFVLVVTPFLETFIPDKSHGDNIFSTVIGYIAIVGIFSFFAWVILFVTTIVRQTFYILTTKD